MRTLVILLDKEFRQLLRNPFLSRLIVIFPVIIMLLMPWVTTMDVRHVGVAIVDDDRSSLSRRMIADIEASDYFTVADRPSDYSSALASLERGEVDVIISVPDNFERNLCSAQPDRISVAANAVNATKGSIGMQYVVQTIAKSISGYVGSADTTQHTDIIITQNRYNPTLDYRRFMIPALMIMLLIMICGFLAAVNIVIEKENGTIEQINVTPVSRLTFTLAKLIPFWIIGLFVLSVAMVVAWVVYGVTPVGSLWVIYLASLLFIFTFSGFGVAIANKSDNIQQTMFVMFFFVMISVLLSGLITPIDSMPEWAQWFTTILPPRYYIEIMRAVYLKGTTFIELSPQFAALTVSTIVFNVLAALTYKKQL